MVLIHCRFLICNLLRRLQNAQRLFERVVLIQEDIGVNITLNLRAIQIFPNWKVQQGPTWHRRSSCISSRRFCQSLALGRSSCFYFGP